MQQIWALRFLGGLYHLLSWLCHQVEAPPLSTYKQYGGSFKFKGGRTDVMKWKKQGNATSRWLQFMDPNLNAAIRKDSFENHYKAT
jgi:hypothetical protein